MSIVTIGYISLRPIVYVLENFQRTFANLVEPPSNEITKSLVRCTGGPVIWQMAEISCKSIHKWRRYPFLNAYKNDEKCVSEFGALLWRHLTPQRKPPHGCTTTVTVVHNGPKIGKFTSCMTFGAHTILVVPSLFWTFFGSADLCSWH